MDWARQCVVIIPCFNEAASISDVVAAVRQRLPNVIVVDDGSTDDTSSRASAVAAETIRLPANRGKGAALREGFRRAHARGFSWALTLDGDGQHAPEDIPAFLSCAEQHGAALVVGNRLAQAVAMPWLRRRTNLWMTRRLSRLTGVTLADSQCGFRLVSLLALAQLELATNRFEIESEMLVAFLAAGKKVEFVPVQVIYKAHPSKIHPLLDAWRWLKWWMKQRGSTATLPHSACAGASRKNNPVDV